MVSKLGHATLYGFVDSRQYMAPVDSGQYILYSPVDSGQYMAPVDSGQYIAL